MIARMFASKSKLTIIRPPLNLTVEQTQDLAESSAIRWEPGSGLALSAVPMCSVSLDRITRLISFRLEFCIHRL
jgi:hypothetical protein